MNENATNSDIALYLSETHSGKTVIKAEADYSLSVETTSEGINNTLSNRLIAWEDVAPVVRSLGMEWKAEHENAKITFYTLNIESNSFPTFYDDHIDAVEAYLFPRRSMGAYWALSALGLIFIPLQSVMAGLTALCVITSR